MTIGLKIFWGILLTLLLAGFLYLAFVGVPSPAVDMREKIDVEKMLK